MAIIRCKMCGGDLLLQPEATTARCEYCGSLQTVPQVDQEKKWNLFTRANRLRFGCEFDKAYGVYETIVGEYPQEPEAYWGLVLCQYGIEYVDDPLTAKKIPTCHRASFQSVLEDSNYELALEYADVEARKLYRQEAKAIEKLRKEIQEISAREAPYDIFICYKETAVSSNERTLDSVLAQDLYDTLTARGYRVFFARVTLEDKVGQAYEPYIFAALNSAKIMLAVGTDYEHFHAVWVKNEWNRFLLLMQENRDKYLIPCYKDMEIEDLPKEFRRLQAQNLGKVGAVQDLLRGIEKLLPREKKSTATFRKNESPAASLLERGTIALEDRQWRNADDCFDKALQQDPRNAQAYIGKLLAREHRRSLDALVEKWVESHNNTETVMLSVAKENDRYRPENDHPALEKFLQRDTLDGLYRFSSEYPSEVESCEQQYQKGMQLWNDTPELCKAREYADEETAAQLQEAKERFLYELLDNLDRARENAQRAEEEKRREYCANLEKDNQKAEELYRQARELLEARYRYLCETGKNVKNAVQAGKLAFELEEMGDFKDAVTEARALREKAKELARDQKRREQETQQLKEAAIAYTEKWEERKAWLKKLLPVLAVILVFIVSIMTECAQEQESGGGYEYQDLNGEWGYVEWE